MPFQDPRSLFDSGLLPPENPGHRPFLRRARKERERHREDHAQLALAGFLVATLVDRMLRVARDPADEDGFKWQLRSTVSFVQELPASFAETAHLAALTDTMEAASQPGYTVVRMSLIAYAYFLSQESRLEDALDILELASRTHEGGFQAEEFASFAMFVGRVNRRLTNWEAAERAYEAARQTAEGVGDDRTALLSQLGMANLHRATGDLRRSERLVEGALARSRVPELADVQSAAYSDLAAVYEQQGRLIEAVAMAYHAFTIAVDDVSRWRTLANLGSLLAAIGECEAARWALEVVASRSDVFASRNNAIIELLDVTSGMGDQLGFHRHHREAARCADSFAPSMAVDYRFQAGIGMVRLGRLKAGRDLLAEALELARTHGLNSWYFRVERVLTNLDVCRDAEQVPTVECPWDTSSLQEITTGLEQLAAVNL